MNVHSYLPAKPTAEDVKRFKREYKCSYFEAKRTVNSEYHKEVKESLINAAEDAKALDDLKKIVIIALKLLI